LNGGTFADAVPNLAGAAMLLLGLLLPLRQRGRAAARSVAWQGGLLALAAAVVASRGGGAQLWLLALGALAGRAVFLPTLLRLASAGRSGGDASARPGATPGAGALLLAGGGLAVLAVAAVSPAGSGVEAGAREGLALALAVLLAGLLAMIGRRGAPSALLGLIAAENGALLGVVHAGGVSGAAVLAVLSPGLVACAALALRGSVARAGSPVGAARR